jgi:crossover junction endodeoxyribonuclease RuvC
MSGRNRILGVDPGSRLLGYGLIEIQGRRLVPVDHGTLRLANTSGEAKVPLELRLLGIQQGLSALIRAHNPQVLAIERVFFAKNAASALKLGQARGAAILTAMMAGLEIAEYSATEIKSAVVGHGGADKNQVAQMVRLILGHIEFQTLDASDALAAAICHAQRARSHRLSVPSTEAKKLLQKKGRKKSSGRLADILGLTALKEVK